ncbi:pantetheine-phosphate adenylyltransferase [bacterium]|nr:pantetheine-phosphate adenylyltransferase [bacterium]
MLDSAVYPGTFDPITRGHLNILARTAALFPVVHVLIAVNPRKRGLFTPEEREEMVEEAVAECLEPAVAARVKIHRHDGLLAYWMRERDVRVIVRGLRAVSDYEYELQMSLMNRQLHPECETLFLVADPKWSFVSSALVCEVASLGGDVSCHLPSCLVERVVARARG